MLVTTSQVFLGWWELLLASAFKRGGRVLGGLDLNQPVLHVLRFGPAWGR
jgi:hypothetical protein